jgi:hypothetical protein
MHLGAGQILFLAHNSNCPTYYNLFIDSPTKGNDSGVAFQFCINSIQRNKGTEDVGYLCAEIILDTLK